MAWNIDGVEYLRKRGPTFEEKTTRERVDREQLLKDPANPKVLFNDGLGQALAVRRLRENVGAFRRRHSRHAVQAVSSAIVFATS